MWFSSSASLLARWHPRPPLLKTLVTWKKIQAGVPTFALDVIDGRRVAITLPRGAVVKVVAGPTSDGDRLVDVISEGRVVTLFAFDLTVRGTEIKDPGTEGFRIEKSARA